jgi:phenylalanyl-tRNA synthetase alpha chain|tara:strand:+ start:651 stop:1628 length:978 start_codon:yes stop_codon:yes gene_type:complete
MDLDALKADLKKDFSEISSQEELNILKVKYLGKKGHISELSKNIKNLSKKDRPEFGKAIGELRKLCEENIFTAQEKIEAISIKESLEKDQIDITLPGSFKSQGKLHPLTVTTLKITDFFSAQGYLIEDGPEIESDYYNFDALNIPLDHPARDMHDTFYLDNGDLLRTHTSPVQIRAIEKRGAPLKIICPGKVYRSDADKTHTPMFHQIEGLVISENVNFGHLKNEIMTFIDFLFGPETKVRFRPSYFPFTEPSAEVDIMDKKTKKWLEIMGCGLVHPNVIDMAGLNSKQLSGFAFGMGIERMAKLLYELEDMRSLFTNDIKFLSQ